MITKIKPAVGLTKNVAIYGDKDFSLFLRRAFIKGSGYTDETLTRPIVGIINTGSGFNPCHANAPALIEAVKRGVLVAGGFPVEFPTISIHESFSHPTSMYLRNLMAMDTEEMIRAQPMDSVVLVGGCDKTVPAQLMGAASAGIPAIQLVSGPMLTGSHRGQRVGACSDCRRFWGQFRASEIDQAEIDELSSQLVPSVGTCCVMGTASTMACLSEALGIMPVGGASAPAVTADRIRIAETTGRLAVGLISKGLSPEKILSPKAFENALRVLLAIGGSTNAIIHLTAIAGRLGIGIDLDSLDRMSRETRVLVDLKPSGNNYMEDFHRAGGMPAVFRELKSVLHLDAMTVTGRTLGDELAEKEGPRFPQDIIRPAERPVYEQGGIAVLRGNLAPGGAIIKQSSASPRLMEHEGCAIVFENAEDMMRRIDDPELDVAADNILVLRNIGPVGAPGMPEAGNIPIPRKLARQGVTDMVRISDGRMSGTASGTIILHVTPEAAVGGPLGLVRNGDRIRLSVANRLLAVLVDASELARRAAALKRDPKGKERGYRKLFLDSVNQADQGCDFDFMRAIEITERVPK